MIKVMLIEDEEKIRKILKKMIEKVDGFEVIAEGDSFASSIQEFSLKKPDVIFVDVDLNGESGLECAKIITNINPDIKIIFATAHSEYMANAFEIYAFDYLVKPFSKERIEKTLGRIKSSLDAAMPANENNLKNFPKSENENDKILIKGKEQVYFVNKKDIIMIEREERSTNIITKSEIYRTASSLTEFEEKLSSNFLRSHKSYIINIDKISKTEVYGRWTYIVKFKDIEKTALITSENYDELKKRFE